MGFLGDIASTALGFVPAVGPFLSKGFDALRNSSSGKALSEGISGAVSGIPSALLQNKLNQANSARSFEDSMKAYGSRYQMTTADMRAAGLNPVLAASSGFNVGNAPTRPQIPGVNMGTGASSARDIKETHQLDAKKDQIKQQIKESQAKVKKMGAELFLANSKAWEAVQRTSTLMYQAIDLQASAKQKNAIAAKIRKEIRLIEAALIRAVQIGKIHKGTKGAILNWIGEVGKLTGLKLGAGMAVVKGIGGK